MRRPQPSDLPPRRSNNDKRRLAADPPSALLDHLRAAATYKGSPKHKSHPHLYNLPQLTGSRGDATLCDRDAGFQPEDMRTIPKMIRRGIKAGLVDKEGRIIWTVADDGWMFELRQTNATLCEYHGYPLRQTEAIASQIFDRFAPWAQEHGTQIDQNAAEFCRLQYGFRNA